MDPNVHEAEQELQEVTVLLRESLLASHTQGKKNTPNDAHKPRLRDIYTHTHTQDVSV